MAFLSVFAGMLAPVQADVIRVPSQVADLQDAIDMASPGDVLLIDGGTHGPILVDIPLTLVGVAGNRPFLRAPFVGESGDASVQLAGPGSGVVTLSSLDIGGTIDGTFFGLAHAGIRGTGFDELRITHCGVLAPTWIMPTGIGDGGPAIDIDIPLLVVQDSVVIGGSGTDDGSGLSVFAIPRAGLGIDTTGDVVLHEAWVAGGAGYSQVAFDPLLCPLPCGMFSGGQGGTGLRANVLWAGSNTVAGGAGGVLSCPTSPIQCVFADGQSLDVQGLIDLVLTLETFGPITLGEFWVLAYGIQPMAPAYLALSLFPTPPTAIAEGTFFMDPANFRLRILPATPGGVGIVQFAVPADPVLVGLTVVLQTWQAGVGLSAPVMATATEP
jgi:hypothetical protein